MTHITSPPPPKDKAPQDPHFERWHPCRKAIFITEWINRCTEKARLNRLSDDDTLAYMKLALSSVSGDFEALTPEVRNNLANFEAWLQKQYQPLFPHHAIIRELEGLRMKDDNLQYFVNEMHRLILLYNIQDGCRG